MGRILVPPKNAPESDVVYTPEETAIEIIDHFCPWGDILDPCMGDGAFYNNLPGSKELHHWCELSKGKDFFDFHTKVNWIISNPPWSMIKPFLIHSMEIADDIVYFITINHYTTKARLRLIHQAGFGIKEIYNIKTPPKPWPQSGFQTAAIHIQRGWTGPISMTGEIG